MYTFGKCQHVDKYTMYSYLHVNMYTNIHVNIAKLACSLYCTTLAILAKQSRHSHRNFCKITEIIQFYIGKPLSMSL